MSNPFTALRAAAPKPYGARDPKDEPVFGDVFRWTEPAGAKMEVVFICGDDQDWTALDLPDGGITTGYVSVQHKGWKFVENVVGFAVGGPMLRFLSYTHKELLELPKAEYDRLRLALGMMTAKELGAMFAKVTAPES